MGGREGGRERGGAEGGEEMGKNDIVLTIRGWTGLYTQTMRHLD